MTWFFVDDNLPFHRKVVAAGNPAMGLWVRAGAWCTQQLTDGHVPEHMATVLGTAAQAARLVKVGLWVEVDDGFRFHEWAGPGRQKTREQVEEERGAARERMRRLRAGTGSGSTEVRPNTDRTSPEVRDPRPVPSRPVRSVVEVVDQPHLADVRAKIDDYHLDLIANACRGDRVWAEEVITLVLAGRTDIRDPGKYVLGAVNANPDRYRPTFTPDPFVSNRRSFGGMPT